MSYMKGQYKERTPYVSVNTLVQPKKVAKNNESPVEIEKDELVTAETSLANEQSAQEVSNGLPGVGEAFETGPGEAQAEIAPESSGFEPAQQMEPPGELALPKETFALPAGVVPEDEEESETEKRSQPVQKKAAARSSAGDSEAALNQINSARGSGQPLPESIRAKMEPALGMDLQNVRLHQDESSAALAGELGARAFTSREDIYFNQGEYNPGTAAGEHLLAHELSHVKQQQTVPGLQYQLQIPAERDHYEREADAVAERVVNAPRQTGTNIGITPTVKKNGGESLQLAVAQKESNPDINANWLLEKVSGLVRNLPGYDLLTLALGRDPFTGQAVKGDGLAWGKALAGLLPGGAALFENLEKAKVISRAVAWFKEEFAKLGITFAVIKSLFEQAWAAVVGPQSKQPEAAGAKQSGWFDNVVKGVKDMGSTVVNIGKALLNQEETFNKLKQIFLAPINRIGSFVAKAGPKLMDFIFEGAMALAGNAGQKIMGILNQGKGVLQQIISDPVGFLKNLITAVRTGLGNFLANIGGYLQTGLAGWLFGALGKAGIVLPEKLNLAGIFSLMSQILGVTWQAIRAQVVKRLGPIAEKVMEQVEKGVAMVTAFITKGPIALLEMAKGFLGELKALFFDAFIGWLRNTVIGKAVQKLISMFNPVGALAQGVITIYNMIQFFLERANQIAALVNAIFNSIAEIAAGNLKKAVAAVEDSLAKALPVAISFLARLVGIGGIAEKIKEIIQKIREPIDKVVGKVVGFIADKAKALIGKITGADKPKEELPKTQEEHDTQVKAGLAALDKEQQKEDEDHNGALTQDEAIEAAQKVKSAYPVFKSITPVEQGGRWVFEYVASKGKHEGLKVESFEEHEKDPAKTKVNEKGITERPKFEVSRGRYPNHVRMLEHAKENGHSLIGLEKGSGVREAQKNRYYAQREIRKKQGPPPDGFDYDEFPYASTKQGGLGAYVELVPSGENQAVGRDLGQFYSKNKMKEYDKFDVKIK